MHPVDHVQHLCCLVIRPICALVLRVYGIALYLWFSAEMYLLDDLGESIPRRSVGLRFARNASLAAREWVQSWQCSLSNVGNRLSYR